MNSELFELYNKSIQSKSGTLKIFSAYVNKKDHYKNLLIESTNFFAGVRVNKRKNLLLCQ